MAAITESLPLEQLQAQAREVHPGRAVATAVLWVFVALGWAAGALARGLVMCALSVRYGGLRGWGLSDEGIAKRAVAKAAGKTPEPAPGN